MIQLPKPLKMTLDNFSLEEEKQPPCDIQKLPPEEVSDDGDVDDDVSGNDCTNSPLPLAVSITAIL